MTGAVMTSEAVDEESTQRVLGELIDGASIATIFERRVSEHPDKVALQTSAHEFTYRQVNDGANQVARCLDRELGSGDGSVVLWLDNDFAVAASLMGVWKAGRTFIPGNLQAPDVYNRELFSTAKPGLVLTSRALRAQVETLVAVETRIRCWEDLAADETKENLGLNVPPEAVLRIVFTSGSSGKPKGVEHDQQGMLHEAYSAIAGAGYRTDDRFLQLSSLSHVNGSDWLFYVFMMGATLSCYPLRSSGVERLGDWVLEKKITRFVSVPTVFRHFVRLPGLSREMVRSVRVVHLGGEPVRPDDLRRFQSFFDPGTKLIANIGSTEGGSFARCIFSTDTTVPEKLLPLGQPHPGIRLEIWDETEREVPVGEVGEIIVCSRGVARGYFNQPELTQAVFRSDPTQPDQRRFKTGDLGWFDEQGLLHSAGRRDRQVKIRGHRVELREIEDRIAEFPGVANVAVGPWSGDDVTTRLIANFSVEPGAAVTEASLRNWLRERLPHYMVPGLFRRIENWPILASGKIDREALVTPFVSPVLIDQPIGGAKQPTTTETKLIGICRRVFDCEAIESNDNFFSLGGDSLHATSLLADVEAEMGRKLSMEAILETPTLRELATRIEEAPELAGNFVRLGGRNGDVVLVLVHGWGGTIAHYLEFAHLLRFAGPIVGLQGNEQIGRMDRPDSLPRLADYYAELILQEYPDNKYVLAGYSAGGVMAYAVGVALRAKGHPVELLITLDSRPNGLPLRRRGGMMWPYFRSRISFHRQRLKGLGPRALWQYLTGRAQASVNLAKRVARPVPKGQDYYIDMLNRHRLESCEMPTAVVQCDQTREQLIEGWQYLSAGRSREYVLHGCHEHMLKGEALVKLVGLFERVLGEHQINLK